MPSLRFPLRSVGLSRRSLVLSAAAVLLLACGGEKDGDTAAATDDAADANADATSSGSEPRRSLELPVVAEEAREGDLVLRVKTTGQVRSDAVVQLRTEVAGTLVAVRVRPGSRVRRGDTLALLDPTPLELAVREAQAQYDEAEQRYLELYLPDSLITGRAPTEEQRRALQARSGLPGAAVRLERARWEREKAAILAPVAGVIDRVDVAPGERVGASAPVATVVDLANLRIEAQVLEHDLPLVRVGGEALVTSAAVPGRTLRGRVEAVLPIVDSVTRAGRAVVRVPGGDALRPGMYADVELEAQRLEGRRIVPARAVIERDGRPLVFVVRDGRAQWTYITPGRSNGLETEVLPDSSSGIIPVEAGDLVITDGHLTLTHDAPVRISAVRERDGGVPATPGN